MPMTRIEPYRPSHPTIRELMEGRLAGEDDGGVPPKGYLGRPPKSAYRSEDRAEALRREKRARYSHGAGTTSGEHTEQENDSKRAGRRQGVGEGGEERKKINFNEGIKGWDASEGRPPGLAGDRQGPRHRMTMRLEVSTERSRDRWRCSVVVRACREGGTTRQTARRGKKTRTAPHSATGGRAAQSERAARKRDGAKRADEGPQVA